MVELSELTVKFALHIVIKEQVLADFILEVGPTLSEESICEGEKREEELAKETRKLYSDGSSSIEG